MDDSDSEGDIGSHDSGRSSPDMPEGEGDDREPEPDTDGEYNDNDEPENGLPRLITPGDSGIENSYESDSEDEPWEVDRNEEDAHYKGTEFYK